MTASPTRGLVATVAHALARVPSLLLSVPVWIYRVGISPWKPPTCRFRPTCSAYALEALRVHGALRGGWLAAKRICRCHPFTEPGFDPVPQPRSRSSSPIAAADGHGADRPPADDHGAS